MGPTRRPRVRAGLDLVWSPGAEGPIVSLIDSARTSLLVESEEMDDSTVTSALAGAARRGVKVEVVMTNSPSWADAFTQLVDAGVKVSTYPSDGPLYIHAKVVVADGTSMFLGSQNFSASSLDDNRELGIITTNPALLGNVSQTVGADFAGATPFQASASAPSASSAGHERTAVVHRHCLTGQRWIPRRLRRVGHVESARREGDGVGCQRHLE